MNLTQKELAVSLKTQQGTISKVESVRICWFRRCVHVEAMGGELGWSQNCQVKHPLGSKA